MNQHPPFRLFTAETPSTRETEQRFRLHPGVCNLTKAGGPKVTTPLKPPTEGLVRSLAVGVAGCPESLRAARGLSLGPGLPHQARHPAGHRADQNVKVASRSGADEGRPGPRGTPVTAAGPRGAPAGLRQQAAGRTGWWPRTPSSPASPPPTATQEAQLLGQLAKPRLEAALPGAQDPAHSARCSTKSPGKTQSHGSGLESDSRSLSQAPLAWMRGPRTRPTVDTA